MLNRVFNASTQFSHAAGFVQAAEGAWRLMPVYNRAAIGIEHRWLNVCGLPRTPEAADGGSASLKRASMALLNHMLDQVERHKPEAYDTLWQSWPAEAADDDVADYFYGHGLGALGEISQMAFDNVKRPSGP